MTSTIGAQTILPAMILTGKIALITASQFPICTSVDRFQSDQTDEENNYESRRLGHF